MLESENNKIAPKENFLQTIIIKKKKNPLCYSFITTNIVLNFTPKIDTYNIKKFIRGKKN